MGASITLQAMRSIALGYFNLSKTTVKILEAENKDDLEAFNRAVIEKWENHSSGGALVSYNFIIFLIIIPTVKEVAGR